MDFEALNDLALDKLMCPVCMDYCLPPIMQCVNGHNICEKCRPRITRCAVCKATLTVVRNLFAEQMCPNLKFPCKYSGSGCELKIELRVMKDHLLVCPFATRCQLKQPSKNNDMWYVPCSWSGCDYELTDHLRAHHESHLSSNASATHEYPLRRKVDARLIQSGIHLFWSILWYDFKTYIMSSMVFYIGPKEVAANYAFKYELQSKNMLHVIVHQGDVISTQGLNPDLKKYFEKDYSALESDDKTVIFCGRENLKRFIEDGVFKCQVSITTK